MQINDDPKSGIPAPFHAVVQQGKGFVIPFSGFVPHLYFIDRQTDMIKTTGVDEQDIFFRKKRFTIFTSAIALRQPVGNVSTAWHDTEGVNICDHRPAANWVFRLAGCLMKKQDVVITMNQNNIFELFQLWGVSFNSRML